MNTLLVLQQYQYELMNLGVAATVAATPESGIMDVVKAISDFGVTIVIAAIVLIFMSKFLNNMLERDSIMINNVGPRLGKLSSTLHDFQKAVNEAISSHNTHVNKTLASMQRDNQELLEKLQHTEEMVANLTSKMDVVESNYKIVCQLLKHYMKAEDAMNGENDPFAFIEAITTEENNDKK